jgi:hypothetical protein
MKRKIKNDISTERDLPGNGEFFHSLYTRIYNGI